jgi:hypothetical protein
MIKAKFNKSVLKLVDNIKKEVDKQTQEALNRVVNYATANTQNSFDRFYDEVPADDPFVFVKNTPMVQLNNHTWARTIKCTGNQVLFIEFGAGKYYYTNVEARMYSKYLGYMKDRPSGIYDIGGYMGNNDFSSSISQQAIVDFGRKRNIVSRGKDDVWFYKSKTGRESENAHIVKYNRSGDPIMITHGNRPARALYRGVGLAIRKLVGGKLK